MLHLELPQNRRAVVGDRDVANAVDLRAEGARERAAARVAPARARALGPFCVAASSTLSRVTHEHLVQADRAQAALDNVGQRHARRHCGRVKGAEKRQWKRAGGSAARRGEGGERARTILLADVGPAKALAVNGKHFDQHDNTVTEELKQQKETERKRKSARMLQWLSEAKADSEGHTNFGKNQLAKTLQKPVRTLRTLCSVLIISLLGHRTSANMCPHIFAH